ncbi:MAG: hypothetical protein EXX96DRAFT_608659 [Benjaminiella poitrasii]|nr:MAG: hypothetical protein EXX96DRAFT_608659 [Benjaminiella poitrasii]
MSSLRSFFSPRRSRRNSNNKNERISLSDRHVAVQAPQPVYKSLPKPTTTTTTVLNKKRPIDTVKRSNSILNYLSPKIITPKSVEEEDEPIKICKIRRHMPVAQLWNTIMEEFDSQSQTNQLHGTPEHSDNEEEIEEMAVGSTKSTKKRSRERENMARNVRTRRTSADFMMEAFDQDDYLIDDVEEDLSRPLLYKRTLAETNAYLLKIADEFLALSDNRWFQIKTC